MGYDCLWACSSCRSTVAGSIGIPPDLDECPTCGEQVDHWQQVDA